MILPIPTTKGLGELHPFLKAKDIPPKGITTITLLGPMRRSRSQFGDGIDLNCKIGAKTYSWTIKFESGTHGTSPIFPGLSNQVRRLKESILLRRYKTMPEETKVKLKGSVSELAKEGTRAEILSAALQSLQKRPGFNPNAFSLSFALKWEPGEQGGGGVER